MKTAILPLLVVALCAGGAAAQNEPSLRDLRVTFDKANVAFRAGDDSSARAACADVSPALAPAFAAGQFRPQSSDEQWVLHADSVLMLSDLWHYRLHDPRQARDLEAELARKAEDLMYLDLTAAHWLSVADLERYDLRAEKAALAAYRRVVGLASIDRSLRNQAVQGLAHNPGGEQGAWKSAHLDVPLSLQHVEATSLVIPQLGITQATLGAESRQYRSGFGRAAAGEAAIASC